MSEKRLRSEEKKASTVSNHLLDRLLYMAARRCYVLLLYVHTTSEQMEWPAVPAASGYEVQMSTSGAEWVTLAPSFGSTLLRKKGASDRFILGTIVGYFEVQ